MNYRKRLLLLSFLTLFMVMGGTSANPYYSWQRLYAVTGNEHWDRIESVGSDRTYVHGEVGYYAESAKVYVYYYVNVQFDQSTHVKVGASWTFNAAVRAYAFFWPGVVKWSMYYFAEEMTNSYPRYWNSYPGDLACCSYVTGQTLDPGFAWPYYWATASFYGSRSINQWYEIGPDVNPGNEQGKWISIGVVLVLEINNYAEMGYSYSSPAIFDMNSLQWAVYNP